MRLLLDTHVLIWSQLEPMRLPPNVAAALDDPANEIWLSPLTWWELELLVARHRIETHWTPRQWALRLGRQFPLLEASLTTPIVLLAGEMRFVHRDPVDRFLAATARHAGLTLVTADARLLQRTDISLLPCR